MRQRRPLKQPLSCHCLSVSGLHADGVGTSALAGKLRIDRPLDPDIRRIFQSSTEHVYDEFIQLVFNSRPILTIEEVNEVARGRVWTGAQAVEKDLVDHTGSLQDAIDATARIAGLGDDYSIHWTEPELTTFERLVLEMTSGVMSKLDFGSSTFRPGKKTFLVNMLEDLRVLVEGQHGLTIAAHCLCGVE